jgi:hypothetical protein
MVQSGSVVLLCCSTFFIAAPVSVRSVADLRVNQNIYYPFQCEKGRDPAKMPIAAIAAASYTATTGRAKTKTLVTSARASEKKSQL